MKNLIILAAMLGLSACGGKKSSNSNSFVLEPYTIEEALAEQDFSCEQGSCPSGVVRLLRFDKSGSVFTCSGFLIAPNIVATNGHCIPKDSHKQKFSCDSLYVVGQSMISGQHQNARCYEVIDSKEDEDTDQDYAIIKLSRSLYGKVFDLDLDGVRDRETLTAWTVNQEGLLKATIQKKTCTAMMRNILKYDFFRSDAPVIGYSCNQKVIKGNSGSVMTSSLGKAKAIVSHTINSEAFPSGYLKERPFGFATNLRCLENAYVKGSKSSGLCALSAQELEFAKSERIIQNDLASYSNIIKTVDSHLTDSFELYGEPQNNEKIIEQVEKLNLNLTQLLMPSCFKNEVWNNLIHLNGKVFNLPVIHFGIGSTHIMEYENFEQDIRIGLTDNLPARLNFTSFGPSALNVVMTIEQSGEKENYIISKCREKSTYLY